jgi:hypothetical protein
MTDTCVSECVRTSQPRHHVPVGPYIGHSVHMPCTLSRQRCEEVNDIYGRASLSLHDIVSVRT